MQAGREWAKGSIIMEPARIHYFLAIAADMKAEIEQLLQQIEKRRNRGRALILLQQCLERGELSVEDVGRILEEHGEEPQEIFRLVEELTFADAIEVNAVAKADIEDLRQRPLRLGKNDHINGVTLTNDARDERFVTNCKEYDTAIGAGYFALSNYDMKMSVFFRHQCGLLSALESARTADTSFIAEPRACITDLHLMPFFLFPWIGDRETSEDATATYQNKVDDGTLVVKRLKQNMLSITEPEGMGSSWSDRTQRRAQPTKNNPNRTMKGATINRELECLKCVFDLAVKRKYIPENPAATVKHFNQLRERPISRNAHRRRGTTYPGGCAAPSSGGYNPPLPDGRANLQRGILAALGSSGF
jgi:hypothetical protein